MFKKLKPWVHVCFGSKNRLTYLHSDDETCSVADNFGENMDSWYPG